MRSINFDHYQRLLNSLEKLSRDDEGRTLLLLPFQVDVFLDNEICLLPPYFEEISASSFEKIICHVNDSQFLFGSSCYSQAVVVVPSNELFTLLAVMKSSEEEFGDFIHIVCIDSVTHSIMGFIQGGDFDSLETRLFDALLSSRLPQNVLAFSTPEIAQHFSKLRLLATSLETLVSTGLGAGQRLEDLIVQEAPTLNEDAFVELCQAICSIQCRDHGENIFLDLNPTHIIDSSDVAKAFDDFGSGYQYRVVRSLHDLRGIKHISYVLVRLPFIEMFRSMVVTALCDYFSDWCAFEDRVLVYSKGKKASRLSKLANSCCKL